MTGTNIIVRTFTAFSVDWIICVVINLGFNYISAHYFDGVEQFGFMQIDMLKWVLWAAYFVLLPKYWKKQTIGNALVKVKIVSDEEGQEQLTFKDLLYRNIILYFFEPMMVLISVVLLVSTANAYVEQGVTNIERSVLTLMSLIYFPIVFVVLMKCIVKKRLLAT